MHDSPSDILPKRMLNSVKRGLMLLRGSPDGFLRFAKGVIHVGANSGQERDLYNLFGLRVLWIEPVSDIFRQLQLNIAGYASQQAVQALVTNEDDKEYEFHITNNAGESSSIYALKDHREIWPEVSVVKSEKLISTRLDTLLKSANHDAALYDTLIMDTQGSELLVLKGAVDLLARLRFVKAEAADFESYEGCCVADDLRGYLEPYGFRETARVRFAGSNETGNYYNLLFERVA
jgi:FkbM family methyltransferase